MRELTGTVRELIADGARRLDQAGIDSPRLDAEVLLAHVLGVTRWRLFTDAMMICDRASVERFEGLVARRCEHEPVAYLVGARAFRHLELAVDRRVLIPRPETELLVEVALDLPAGARVLDIGTGSGAVALALAQERPDLEVWGSDISANALAVAQANARALGLAVRFVVADLMAGVPGAFDAVVANLPYVADAAALPPDVSGYEPAVALFGGPDGLAVVRRLLDQLGSVPWVGLEIGAGQDGAVVDLLTLAGFGSVARHADLAGIQRVVVGRR